MNQSNTARRFFPIQNDDSMQRFLENDSTLKTRQEDFQYLLFTVITEGDITQRQFSDTLVNTLFTRDYLKRYRWPNAV